MVRRRSRELYDVLGGVHTALIDARRDWRRHSAVAVSCIGWPSEKKTKECALCKGGLQSRPSCPDAHRVSGLNSTTQTNPREMIFLPSSKSSYEWHNICDRQKSFCVSQGKMRSSAAWLAISIEKLQSRGLFRGPTSRETRCAQGSACPWDKS